MTSREFCYWLQGFFELEDPLTPTRVLNVDQVAQIKKHLSMVFIHEIDPSYPNADKLDAAHNGPGKPPHGAIPRC